MSKGQNGNKEAKKPKKVQAAPKPLTPAEAVAGAAGSAADRQKKKR